MFFFLGGWKGMEVTLDLGLSLLNCLGHNSECVDMCGCFCVISSLQAPLQGNSLRHFQACGVKMFLMSCLKPGQQTTLCRAAVAMSVQQLMQCFHSW